MIDISGYTLVAPGRYRENKGLFYEDFILDSTVEHTPGRTVIDADNTWLSLIAMNQHGLHIDREYVKGTEFGQLLVSSLVTFTIVNGMTVHTISQNAVANLGWDEVRLHHPVFVGDTLAAETTVLEKRLSRSRPDQGIVTVRTRGVNQHGKAVISFKRTILIPLRVARLAHQNENQAGH